MGGARAAPQLGGAHALGGMDRSSGNGDWLCAERRGVSGERDWAIPAEEDRLTERLNLDSFFLA